MTKPRIALAPTARLAGALDACLLQIAQIRRMFDDADGSIAAAVEEGESVLAALRAGRLVNPLARPLRRLLDCPDLKLDGLVQETIDAAYEAEAALADYGQSRATIPDDRRTITLLEADGFEGPDMSLAISLFEYDIAWRDEGGAYKFIIRRPNGKFDCKLVRKAVNPQREWSCVDYAAFADTLGTTVASWLKRPLTVQVQDLMLYHGQDNVFGSQGWEGFEIEESRKK